ncbi:hypothetical protein AF72_02375 [Xylella taiwanensis]|uniref:Uncharacterized protein n=1 Tax=Xylella taiwanensis TaxID=1444770 RepID=Z9JM96_9GAMM|nr:hypothetical protein AB672_09060 [Xylella taiwanensis]EWS79083.1 hypothetical protein AF72_02375 [Xylella taiwanensis]
MLGAFKGVFNTELFPVEGVGCFRQRGTQLILVAASAQNIGCTYAALCVAFPRVRSVAAALMIDKTLSDLMRL